MKAAFSCHLVNIKNIDFSYFILFLNRGHNVECYRMYEACEAGSIPIVEDWEPAAGEKGCRGSLTPFKNSNAPFLYIKDWATLPGLIEEQMKDPGAIIQRQIKLLEWYSTFKMNYITDFENTLSGLWSKT